MALNPATPYSVNTSPPVEPHQPRVNGNIMGPPTGRSTAPNPRGHSNNENRYSPKNVDLNQKCAMNIQTSLASSAAQHRGGNTSNSRNASFLGGVENPGSGNSDSIESDEEAGDVFVSEITGRAPVARGPQPDSVQPTRLPVNNYRQSKQIPRYKLPPNPKRELWTEDFAFAQRVNSPTQGSGLNASNSLRRGSGISRKDKKTDDRLPRRWRQARRRGFVERFLDLFR